MDGQKKVRCEVCDEFVSTYRTLDCKWQLAWHGEGLIPCAGSHCQVPGPEVEPSSAAPYVMAMVTREGRELSVEMPEHDKLKAVKEKSQACGAFFLWLQQEKKVVFARVGHHHTDDCYDLIIQPETLSEGPHCGQEEDADELVLAQLPPLERLLGEFFKINPDRLAEEKEQLLAAVRTQMEGGQ